ncbi:hypothetical protein PPYR_02620 [Photinus pyralis]|uniref:Reverse transcriptase domain-containing protein n=1 Tax=Photinus pyralis TaxID=7054 RepID=A0A5N4B971_PHOPY|nr:hypothetical protein PPYR_02620 [Photinus pyralis]
MTKGVENLINKRNFIKDKFSRMQTFIEQFNDSEQSITELKVRIPTINAMFNQFDEIQDKIEESKAISNDVKLPTLELPKFDGNYAEYHSFLDRFDRSVHKNEKLSNADKLEYLKGCLTGEASASINVLKVTNDNYPKALEILAKRFKNMRLVVTEHVQKIINSPQLIKNSHAPLRQLIDDITQNLASLNALEIDTSTWDPLIVPLIAAKFDFYTKKEWETTLSSKLPTLLELTDFLEKRFNILRSINTPTPGPSKLGVMDKTNNQLPNKSKKTSNYVSINKAAPACDICNQTDHRVAFKCPDFLNLSINDRIKKAKQLSLCLKCLGKGNHSQEKCRIKWCVICKQAHNVLIHKDDDLQLQNDGVSIQEQSSSMATTSTNLFTDTNHPQVLLNTALVMVGDGVGRKHQLRCLLDNASHSCFITKQAFDKLRLPSVPTNFLVTSINRNNTALNKLVRITMYSNHSNFVTNLECLIVKEISEQLPPQFFDIDHLQIPSNLKLADSNFNIPGEIDMLIGAETYCEIIRSGHLPLGKGKPLLQNTWLGWIVSGAVHYPINKQFMTSCHFSSIHKLETQLQRFWEIEQVDAGMRPFLTQTVDYCEEHFKNNHKRDAEGRFVVKLPFNPDAPTFGNSKQLALSRFLKLEKKLEGQHSLKKEYHQNISEYINQNYLKPIANNEVDTKDAFYLPHHAVIKESSLTTKVRIVFDASAKSDNGISLNDTLYSGPALQQDLFSILCRFRMHQFVISADITKMYLQIRLDESQWQYQRILWRDDKSHEIKTYNLTTVTFGITSSPFLAVRCLNELAFLNQNKFGIATQVILNDFYIDDLLSGGNTFEETNQLRNDLVHILNQAKFKLTKWSSNDTRLLEGLNLDDTVAHKLFAKEHTIHTTKTLGLSWHSQNDVIPVYPYKRIELHTFSDASQLAYGCCAYIRIQDFNNKYHVHLLCAKSKVAPLKTLTIPRLELCAALLSAQLASKLITILNTKFAETYFWCDSTIGRPETIPEQKTVTLTTTTSISLPFIQKFSSFSKLTRICAYLYRFITNCKDKN